MSHPDLDQLLNSLLPFAERMLAEHGEFFPFGGTMKPDGEIVAVGGYDGDEHPLSLSVIDQLTQVFRQQARRGQLRAAGICYDARTIPPGQIEKCDAVCASMEHQSGEAVNVILPYEKTSKGDVQYGQMFTTSRTSQFFVPNETIAVGGWLLVLCVVLTRLYPATSFYYIFSHVIPGLFNPHTPVLNIALFIIYPVLFIPLGVFSFSSGLKLWLVRPGAVSFAKHYFLTYLGAHIAYFFVWVYWMLIFQPSRPPSFAGVAWAHVGGPMLHVAIWYSYLKRSKRVRTTYLSGLDLAVHVLESPASDAQRRKIE
jgi:hypothetical protein